jgi:hypothetical protein
MSECAFVEKPFLDQLAALGWQVIDQGQGVPTDPTQSLRTHFREVMLKGVFRDSLNTINRTARSVRGRRAGCLLRQRRTAGAEVAAQPALLPRTSVPVSRMGESAHRPNSGP